MFNKCFETIFILCFGIGCWLLVWFIMAPHLHLPTVYKSISQQSIVKIVDWEGNEINFDTLSDRYFTIYVK